MNHLEAPLLARGFLAGARRLAGKWAASLGLQIPALGHFFRLGFFLPPAALAAMASPEALAAEAAPTPSALEQFFPFIILGLLFYFLLIRPQQRKVRQHGDFLSRIKRGDEVLTSSGIFGRIEGLTDRFVVLEVADDVRIRVARSQISSYAHPQEEKESKNEREKTASQKSGPKKSKQAKRGKRGG